MRREHSYTVTVAWTGNSGDGTRDYRAYSRNHEVSVTGKPVLPGSSDPAFRGDPARYNPEELLVASLSACHMLWYLHLCAQAKIIVTAYIDHASGVMLETPDGAGRFEEVVLCPAISYGPGTDVSLANQLHERAHQLCFIANSVNFPVRCQPSVSIGGPGAPGL